MELRLDGSLSETEAPASDLTLDGALTIEPAVVDGQSYITGRLRNRGAEDALTTAGTVSIYLRSGNDVLDRAIDQILAGQRIAPGEVRDFETLNLPVPNIPLNALDPRLAWEDAP